MAQNIVVAAMGIIAAAAGIWCFWIENGKSSEKSSVETGENAAEKGTITESSTQQEKEA